VKRIKIFSQWPKCRVSFSTMGHGTEIVHAPWATVQSLVVWFTAMGQSTEFCVVFIECWHFFRALRRFKAYCRFPNPTQSNPTQPNPRSDLHHALHPVLHPILRVLHTLLYVLQATSLTSFRPDVADEEFLKSSLHYLLKEATNMSRMVLSFIFCYIRIQYLQIWM
jgi:hypothetical protein